MTWRQRAAHAEELCDLRRRQPDLRSDDGHEHKARHTRARRALDAPEPEPLTAGLLARSLTREAFERKALQAHWWHAHVMLASFLIFVERFHRRRG